LILALLPTTGFGQTASQLWGRPVVSVNLNCDAHLKLGQFSGAVTQRVGEPLDAAKVSETLKRLYATGRFTELRADAQPEAAGIALTFVARAQYFVGVVTATGNTGSVEPRSLVTASRLRLGEPLTTAELDAAQRRMTDLLASNGYYQVHLAREVQRDADTQEANVAFTIEAGRAARLTDIEFQGDATFPPARLAKVAGWHRGRQLTASRQERGLFRLHQFYVSRGRVQANINVAQRVFDAKTNTEKLTVKVESGPLVRVRVEGAKVSSGKLKSLLPLYRDGSIDEQALARCEEILTDHFQEQGYFSASVKANRTSVTTPPAHVEILFRVMRGRQGEFVGYGVKGNVAVPTSDILSVVSPASPGLFPQTPTFSRGLVERKTAALLALYQERGFQQARVTSTINDRYQDIAGRRYVIFLIQEGEQTTVHDLRLEGIDAATQKGLWSSLLCRPGQPYSPERARTDRDAILDFLGNLGYLRAEASWHATPLSSPTQIDLEFSVQTGVKQYIERVVVLGNTHTRVGLVNRDLTFHRGDPLDQSTLLESQRRLYEVGIFNQVQITPQEGSNLENTKTVLVGLEEARRWSVGYGAGLEVQRLGSNQPQGEFKASPRGSLDITRIDVGGRDQTLTLGGRLSNLDTGANISYLIPHLANHRDLSLRLSGLTDRSREVLTFTADRKEVSISLEKRFSPSSLLIGRYSFRRVEALDISSKVSAEDSFILSQPAHVGMMETSYINDRRDNPIDATRGSYSLVDTGVAWHNLGSQANYVKFTGQNSTYYRLNSFLVFARETQFGMETPYGRHYTITVPASDGRAAYDVSTHEIPLPERLFMGGSESHRGFSINQAGPRDPITGYPLGGNALFLNSLELRSFFPQRNVGFVLFEDAGNVYSSVRLMRLLKTSQNSPTDLNYTSHAVGAGVRYKTPVGPIRFDVGYNLNPPRYNVVNTTNGVRTTEVQQLAKWQFFISIGQSF